MNRVLTSNAKSMRPFFSDNNPSKSSGFNTVLCHGFSQQCKPEQLTKSIDNCLQCSERKQIRPSQQWARPFTLKIDFESLKWLN